MRMERCVGNGGKALCGACLPYSLFLLGSSPVPFCVGAECGSARICCAAAGLKLTWCSCPCRRSHARSGQTA